MRGESYWENISGKRCRKLIEFIIKINSINKINWKLMLIMDQIEKREHLEE